MDLGLASWMEHLEFHMFGHGVDQLFAQQPFLLHSKHLVQHCLELTPCQLSCGASFLSGILEKLMDMLRDRIPLHVVRAESELSPAEKAYLNAVEKGDYASVKQVLEEAELYFKININCIDPLGRTALLIAIENENLEFIELLLSFNVYVGDALLHAIRKEVVGAVELLLNHKKPSGEKQVSGKATSL
ncbi:hypothetical protein E2320_016791 [Naja naja]|nr:hypothetical protein E2320_016791 [Naja naja]